MNIIMIYVLRQGIFVWLFWVHNSYIIINKYWQLALELSKLQRFIFKSEGFNFEIQGGLKLVTKPLNWKIKLSFDVKYQVH